MSIDTRLARIEEERLTIAMAEFAVFWRAYATDEAGHTRMRAGLAEAGCAGESLEAIRAWEACQPADQQRRYEQLETAIFGMVEHTHPRQAIRAALAALAPSLGLHEHDSPIAIIHALQADIAMEP